MTITLLGARICAGLLAGVYLAFAVGVMPALRRLDDAAFTTIMNRINVVIVNPVFLLVFLGAPALAAAVGAMLRTPTAIVAGALGLVTLLVTVVANVPLNDRLAAGGARVDFETSWVVWNVVRTATGIGSLVCLLLVRVPAA